MNAFSLSCFTVHKIFHVWVFVCFVCLKQGPPVDKGKGRKDHLFWLQTAGFRLRAERENISEHQAKCWEALEHPPFWKTCGSRTDPRASVPRAWGRDRWMLWGTRAWVCLFTPSPTITVSISVPGPQCAAVPDLCDKPEAVALRSCLGNGTRSCCKQEMCNKWQPQSGWGWGLWMQSPWPRLE